MSPILGITASSIKKVGTLIVAVKYASSSAATTTDGITWTSRSMPSSQNWYGGASNGTVMVVQSDTTTAATSTDGITWTSRTAPNAFSYGPKWGANKFSGLGSARGLTSPDGITWTSRTVPGGGASDWRNNAYNGSTWAAPLYGTTNAMTSSDATSWTLQTGVMPSSQPWFDIDASSGGTFATMSYNTTNIATSTNGTTWTARTGVKSSQMVSMRWINDKFICIGNNAIQTSPDGVTWTGRTSPTTRQWEGLAGNSNVIVITPVSNNATSGYSTDGGISWSTSTLPSSGDWYTAVCK